MRLTSNRCAGISSQPGCGDESPENAENPCDAGVSGADDRDRTGDLNLGKVALYQLSHVREECTM